MAVRKSKSKGKRKGRAVKPATLDDVIADLGTIKLLLMLQLVASGVKPKDIGVTLNVQKSAMSNLLPVRKLLVTKRESLLSIEPPEITRRLDALIAFAKKREKASKDKAKASKAK
jgi:hypothetical protein